MTEKKQLEGIKESAHARKNGIKPSNAYVEEQEENANDLYVAQVKTMNEE